MQVWLLPAHLVVTKNISQNVTPVRHSSPRSSWVCMKIFSGAEESTPTCHSCPSLLALTGFHCFLQIWRDSEGPSTPHPPRSTSLMEPAAVQLQEGRSFLGYPRHYPPPAPERVALALVFILCMYKNFQQDPSVCFHEPRALSLVALTIVACQFLEELPLVKETSTESGGFFSFRFLSRA